MERFSHARITSDEIQDNELGLKNRNEEIQLNSSRNATQYIQMVFRSQTKNADLKSESKAKRSRSRSKSKVRSKSSQTKDVTKSKSRLLRSFERLRSLTKIKSRSTMKSPSRNSTKRSVVRILDDSEKQDKGVQFSDICLKNKCPLDCKSILEAQREPRTKTPTSKKRYYLIRSKTRGKTKSKSMSDLSDAQKEKDEEKKGKDAAAKKADSRTKFCGKRRAASKSPKKEKTPPPSSPKRKGRSCGKTKTPTKEKVDLKETEEKGKDDKKTKGKKKTRKCYYYRKRPKADKKPIPPSPQPSKSTTPPLITPEPPPLMPSTTSVEEMTPLTTDVSSPAIIPSHETFPSSTITIPTISEITIPHESITDIETSKETPETSQQYTPETSQQYTPETSQQYTPETSQQYTPSEEPHEAKKEEEEVSVPPPRIRRSCMMAGPPPFVCNEDYKFPEFRERMKFTQNRGPIPPVLQPVLGPCEGRLCTMLKGGERGQAVGVKYATVKISFFPEYTTYEVMRSTDKAPKCIPKCIEEVFVTKYEPKSSGM